MLKITKKLSDNTVKWETIPLVDNLTGYFTEITPYWPTLHILVNQTQT